MRMKIAVKLGTTFTAITLVIIAIVTVAVSFMVVDHLQAEAYKRLNNDIDVTMHTFDYFSQDALKTARMLGQNPYMVEDLTGDRAKAVKRLSRHLHTLAETSIVSVYDRDGKVIYDSSDVATLNSPRRHPAALGLALAGEESTGVTVLPNSALAVEATVPVMNGETVVGAVRVGTRLDDAFVDQLKKITGLEVGIAEGIEVGTDKSNSMKARWLAQTIRTADHARLTREVPVGLIRELRDAGAPIRRTVEMQGQSYLAVLAPLYGCYGEFEGTLFIAESVAPLQHAVQETVLMIVGLALVLALLGAIAVRTLACAITDPIRTLATQAARIAKGQLDERVDVHTGDELEQLATAFNRMCDALEEMRFRDQNANPLTKLPGNLMIEAEVNRRLRAGEETAVLYIDLDHFKAFNDKYGFEQGDRVIQLTADILKSVLGENAPHNPNFVGHIGGDDFLAITKPRDAEETCQVLCAEFDRRVRELYPSEDAGRGYIDSVDRQGERRRFPLCSISIALVDNETRALADFLELSSIAAEVKKLAKALPGSSYARDRRTDKESIFLTDW
ncbi:MAG TPA: diguanylate cyclase [Oscillatoriaceae cyanobacterium]